MKRMNRAILLALPMVALASMIGCEFESTDGFNTSQGGGSGANFSGIYTEYRPEKAAGGACGGGGAVVCGTDITRLIITQTGNTIEVYDNHNRYYRGSVGSPGVVGAPLADGSYPAGAAVMAAQVSFGAGDVQFMGVVRTIAVTDIEGEQLVTTVTRSDSEQADNVDTDDETSSTSDSDTRTTETVEVEQQGNETETTTRTRETSTSSTQDDGETETVTTSELDAKDVTYTETIEYSIDESNTHYVLEGNWVAGGTVHEVHGQSHAVNATTFTSDSTATTEF